MGDRRGLRINVFDDDPAITYLLEKILSGLGHKVLTYAEPSEHTQCLRPGQPCCRDLPCADVVISDVMMPGTSGIEMFLHMKDRGCKIQDSHKLLISAVDLDDRLDASSKFGWHFIRKPFTADELVDWVHDCATRVFKK